MVIRWIFKGILENENTLTLHTFKALKGKPELVPQTTNGIFDFAQSL